MCDEVMVDSVLYREPNSFYDIVCVYEEMKWCCIVSVAARNVLRISTTCGPTHYKYILQSNYFLLVIYFQTSDHSMSLLPCAL